jgi:UDP-N-acetylmuramoyl-tripeptide--D-alanyl-D-alanine ligase
MIPLRLGEIDSARLVRGDRNLEITGIVCDSRRARPGVLFVCLRGSRHDGHAFAEDAAARGAAAILCEPGRSDEGVHRLAVLEADEPLVALAGIARLVRRRSRARVVAIAGSAGKTSTKDVLQALVTPHAPTVASPASYNNELGVPLTLSLLECDTALCICELGTGAPGELAELCRIAEPDLGLIITIGPEHLQFFETIEAVAAEEAALIAALPPGAPVVLPANATLLDPYRRDDLDEWRFGPDPTADVHPLGWRPGTKLTDAVFCVRGDRIALTTNLRLPHHRLMLAAAVAAYAALGLPLDCIGDGAAAVELSPWRGQEQPLPGRGLLINDAYNANPVSVAAALEALAARRNGGRAIAVLGEMAELGPDAPRWHARAGRHAAALRIDLLVAVGHGARGYLDGAAGSVECCWFPDSAAAARALRALLRPHDVVLLKGSRTAGLERLAEALRR